MRQEELTFHVSWFDAVKTLTNEDAGILFKAIFEYAKSGNKPDVLPPVLAFPFNLFVSSFDIEQSKADEVSEKRRRAINKRWGKVSDSIQMNTNEYTCIQKIQMNTSDTNVYKREKENEKKQKTPNVFSPTPPISLPKEKDKEKEKAERPLPASYSDAGQSPRNVSVSTPTKQQIIQFWNNTMTGKVIPTIKGLAHTRETWFKARLLEYGVDAVYEVITKAAASSFLNGKNNRGFVASFDWVFRPNNFPKVLEGNYDDKDSQPQPSTTQYGTTRQQREDADRQRRAEGYRQLVENTLASR
jgi:hypothetical protein